MISSILIGLIAALHVYILVLEMFLWETPRARRAFGLSAEFASQTKALAANQERSLACTAAKVRFPPVLGRWERVVLHGA